jgi:F-type H+-transporting ATPase subunit delta
MSDFETVARPYSRAIFELASEQGDLQFWSDVLQLGASLAEDEGLRTLVGSPSVLESDLAELVISVMSAVKDGPKMNQEVKNLVALLAENERLLALPEISTGYETFKQEAEGSIEVEVTSARKLTAKQEQDIAKNMKARLGKEVSITAEVDESLIAGAIIKAGDLVIDGSALGKLNKLTTQLNK